MTVKELSKPFNRHQDRNAGPIWLLYLRGEVVTDHSSAAKLMDWTALSQLLTVSALAAVQMGISRVARLPPDSESFLMRYVTLTR